MNHAIYHKLKAQITLYANYLWYAYPDDTPRIRKGLNDQMNAIRNDELGVMVMRDKLSQKRADLYDKWLTYYSYYSITRHYK